MLELQRIGVMLYGEKREISPLSSRGGIVAKTKRHVGANPTPCTQSHQK